MGEKIEFKGIPKGKEKDRLYHFPVPKNAHIDTSTPFMREIRRLANGDIDGVDLEKVKKEFKTYKKNQKSL